MGLFEEINNNSEKYVNIGFAIECLALQEGNIYKAVMVLLHYKIDEKICCYRQGEFLNFIDIDNDQKEEYSSCQVLKDIKSDADSRGGIDSKELYLSDQIKEKIKNYYWDADDFIELEPIKFFLNNCRKNGIPQPLINEEKTENYPISGKVNYKLLLFKKPLLSIHEAACIISGDEPNTVSRCENDTSFDQNFNDYLYAFNFIESAVMAENLAKDEFQFYGIKNSDFKKYLSLEGIIIDGFNDSLPIENSTNFVQSSSPNTDQNIEIFNVEIKQLKDLITAKDMEINNLTHTINVLGEKHAELIAYNSDLYEENTSLAKNNENNENTIRGLNNSALWQESENSDLEIENRNLKTKIKELEASQPNEQVESKLSTREENNIIRVLAVLMELERKIDMSKPYEAHGIMAQKAQLLGIDPFPSNESIKKWFSKANEYKKS